MADNQEGSSPASKPEMAAIPDLKKAQANALDSERSVGAAASAASASTFAARARPQSALDRLTSNPVKLAVAAALMLIVAAVLSFTAFHDVVSGSGGARLDGVKSTIKFAAGRGQDSTRYAPRSEGSIANGGKMNFGLIKAGGKNPYDIKLDGVDVPGADDAPPMGTNPDEIGGGSASGGAGGSASASDAAARRVGGGASGGAMPKLGSLTGGIKFQGMRRVSGTAGFRDITGNRGVVGRTIQNRGPSANSSGAAANRGGSGGGSIADRSSSGGSGAGAGSAGGSDIAAGGSGGSGGGGGAGAGGAGTVDAANLDAINKDAPSIQNLMEQATAKYAAARKDKEYAEGFAATSQWPQAHYYYDQYSKKQKEGDDLKAKANQQAAALQNAANNVVH